MIFYSFTYHLDFNNRKAVALAALKLFEESLHSIDIGLSLGQSSSTISLDDLRESISKHIDQRIIIAVKPVVLEAREVEECISLILQHQGDPVHVLPVLSS